MNLKTLQQIMSATDITVGEILLVAADACEEMELYHVAERFRQICDIEARTIAFAAWRRIVYGERLWPLSDDTSDAFKQWNEFITEHKRISKLISTQDGT